MGRLVGVGPLVCAGTAYQGQVELENEESASISVTDTTAEKTEAGLSATAGIEYDGMALSFTGSFAWSKETTHSQEVTKTSFSPLETALLNEHARLTAELGPSTTIGTSSDDPAHLLALRAQQIRLGNAAAALGL